MSIYTGKFAVKLKHVTDALIGISGIATTSGSFSTSVQLVSTSDVGGSIPPSYTGGMSSTLELLSPSYDGVSGPATESGSTSITLQLIADEFIGGKAKIGSFLVSLKKIKILSFGRKKSPTSGVISVVAGSVRANGGCILAFKGNPNSTITWVVVSGGGFVIPFSKYTDVHGVANARYVAGGFFGNVTVTATTS